MKTLFLTLVLCAASLSSWAQNIDDVFNQFKNRENATLVNLPKSLISMGLKSSNDEDAKKWADKIESMQILALEDASDALKKELNAAVKKANLGDYEDMIRANSDGEKVRIMTKSDGKEITSLIIFAIDEEDCAIVKIDGHINPKDVDAIVDSQTGK
ncbi:DUF4252 domain-containing protein [Prevotella sp. HUN102]|uniref:DUF4252 domain-containing protein n=1 Tax=Prevotella sp. HUN102 TaxID=1392486 RepID=UPI00048BCD49|nr:DUF4252 domain-containing protein [Prevotella sp. HUN102]